MLALLNSKLLSYLFATRYAAKRLGGGYLAINKGQLVQLPIPRGTDVKRVHRLSQLARRWSATGDAEIDALVYQLYGLTNDEIDRVENHFSKAAVRAA